eukprot:Sspe_Gene.43328::Locus_21107_Transcript_1_2_Confidence_0.667_Length_1047::g.43328::m.43328
MNDVSGGCRKRQHSSSGHSSDAYLRTMRGSVLTYSPVSSDSPTHRLSTTPPRPPCYGRSPSPPDEISSSPYSKFMAADSPPKKARRRRIGPPISNYSSPLPPLHTDRISPRRESSVTPSSPSSFQTPVRSPRTERLEFALAYAVRCSSAVKQQLTSLFDHTPYELTPWLSVSSAKYARMVHRVAEDGYTHVVNLCPAQFYVPKDLYRQHGISLTLVNTDDTTEYPLLIKHFAQCRDVAYRARQVKGRVLIHCLKAVNRSITMALALQVDQEGIDLCEAVVRMASQRAPILQNSEFRKQLIHFAFNKEMYMCNVP